MSNTMRAVIDGAYDEYVELNYYGSDNIVFLTAVSDIPDKQTDINIVLRPTTARRLGTLLLQFADFADQDQDEDSIETF